MVYTRHSASSFFKFLYFFCLLFTIVRAASLSSKHSTTSGHGDYTCAPDSPCSNGACCGASGFCGYGPTYCGDGCQSNCNATAECGQYATTAGAGCPLNVCCSEFGFCGTTSDFCGDGCQSHCTQPKPSVTESNVQKRIVGYWEAWNTQHACGTMGPGEIPVNLLTHLNIAFGYINHDFQVTNMDGLSSDIYRIVGSLKARNPSLKIMIALGGWAFSDPGTWQSVFPTLVSSKENRAAFIKNLLGFLSEYGYDGVDFDWEYPGADDRGGSDTDGENYTQLLKELRAAIKASGREYTVTFTAPTSYWYLRHFDLKGMTDYVDWVNLMSYDLHGVWDSNNPIGSQVLAHTNLTEIDRALDLFWRVDVDPSSIVLGLGFYGRSFQLKSSSCWKPGCDFSGPGAKGRCSGTAGILSYREITDILINTGATAHLDKEAAVRYFVYDNNNWISFDDEITFQTKIEYANKMGLSGLMVWAIDQDDSYLNALRAVSNSSMLDTVDNPFTLVDLKYLFPTEYLPSADVKPSYGLTTFGGAANAGEMDPSGAAFGFLLIAGDSYAVSRLRKRDGEPDPFVFLDCPSEISSAPNDHIHTARVVCLSDDLAGCFRVMERGVEGTIVEMPDNCAPNTFARAISLELSENQFVSAKFTKRSPTSQVFDFNFDFNLKHIRRDTNNTSIRMDFSNVEGYWNQLVNSPGIQDKQARDLVERYFAPKNSDWKSKYVHNDAEFDYKADNSLKINEDISAPIFWQSTQQCPVGGADFGEGFGAYVSGRVDANFYFGFSLIATMTGFHSFDVEQANGFITVDGKTDLTYGIGGVGAVDIARANKGNPAQSEQNSVKLSGQTINAGSDHGWVTFDPYYQITYQMATFNGSDSEDFTNSAAPFNGLLNTRVVSDLGNLTAYFPSPSPDQLKAEKRDSNKISIGKDSRLYDSPGDGGKIALGTFVRFGLNVKFSLVGDMMRRSNKLANVGMVYDTLTEFAFYPGDKDNRVTSCSDVNVTTNIYQMTRDADNVGWSDYMVPLTFDRQSPSQGSLCYPNANTTSPSKRSTIPEPAKDSLVSEARSENNSLMKRQKWGEMEMPGWGYGPDKAVNPNNYFGIGGPSDVLQNTVARFNCEDCMDCEVEEPDSPQRCCGCACMECIYGFSDIPNCLSCDSTEGEWPGGAFLSRRDNNLTADKGGEDGNNHLQRRVYGIATKSIKQVSVCAAEKQWGSGDYRYPAFPRDASFPWDGIQNGRYDPISRYWGNASDSCSNWAVTDKKPADTVYLTSGTQARADYQTEHVFEGQLIGDFFTWWLDKGHIHNQVPAPSNPQPKVPCAFTEQWIVGNFPHWKLGGKKTSFFKLMLAELGSIAHLDRLTLFMARPNGKKGSMFTGNQPTSHVAYNSMTQDEQLQSVKEMGMVFTYLNTQEVWDKFCGTYEAIYDLLAEFDTWYSQNGQGLAIPSLQDEWKEYIRVSLDSLVRRSRTSFDYMLNNRRRAGFLGLSDPPFTFHWLSNRFTNRQLIRLSLTCKNMDPSSA